MIKCFSVILDNIRYDVYIAKTGDGQYYFHVFHTDGHGSCGFFNMWNFNKWYKSKRRFVQMLRYALAR